MPYKKYIVKPRAARKIWSFYRNVARKYRHTYAEEDMVRNIQDAVRSIYLIEHSLLRRQPSLSKWQGFFMANTDKWYFAYTIDNDTIVIVDACHALNMHEKV